MTFGELIEELREKNIEINFSGGKLRYNGPEENITPKIIENLRSYKSKLIKYCWPKELTNLMPINTEGSKQPIFIIHGDNANYIISEYLGHDQPVYGFFHPGSEGEAIRYHSVKEMAEDYLMKLLHVCPEGPYYLIGFSYGGVVAYEMAVQLQKAGKKVPFLVIIDSISPLAKENKRKQKNFFQTVRINILRPIRISLDRKKKLLICKMYIILKKPIPIDIRKEYMYIKYIRFTSRYIPSRFAGDILLFRTTENPSSCKYLGWDTLVNEIKLVEIQGKHLEIFIGQERSEILTTEIEKHLIRAMSNG